MNLYPVKVTAKRDLWSEGVIGPYLLENDDGTTVTVYSERYGHMETDFFCLLLKNTTWRIFGFKKKVPHAIQLELIWLYCKRPRNFLSWRYQLATNIIRFDTIRLFLWGYAKDRVEIDKPLTFNHLKTNIRQIMAEIHANMCQEVVENYLNRISACNISHGEKKHQETNILYAFYLRLLLKYRNG